MEWDTQISPNFSETVINLLYPRKAVDVSLFSNELGPDLQIFLRTVTLSLSFPSCCLSSVLL